MVEPKEIRLQQSTKWELSLVHIAKRQIIQRKIFVERRGGDLGHVEWNTQI